MYKVAVVVLADTDSAGDLGRVVNAMQTVKEFKQAGDEVQLIFDGAGTKWIGELTNPEHPYHSLYNAVTDTISGACAYCASAYGVKADVEAHAVPFAGTFEGHPSFRTLVAEGYQILTF